MVRLEAQTGPTLPDAELVSIPIWCDWKCVFSVTRSFGHVFQFLYGAIGRIIFCFEKIRRVLFQFLYGAIGSLHSQNSKTTK